MQRGLQLAWPVALVALLLGGLLACRGPATAAPPAQTEWFVGQVTRTSPDGRLPYSQAEVVLQRQVLEEGCVVEELRTEAPPSPSMPPKPIHLRYVQQGRSGTFELQGGDPAWQGRAIFQDASLATWVFSLRHGETGPQEGQGSLSGGRLRITRTTGGSRPMRVVEDYRRVSRAEYERALGLMRPPKGAE